MCRELEAIDGVRAEFTGVYDRFDFRTDFDGKPQKTMLLTDIRRGGKTVIGRLWFAFTKGFAKLNLRKGDVIKFDARVQGYIHHREQRYKLIYLLRKDRALEDKYFSGHTTSCFEGRRI